VVLPALTNQRARGSISRLCLCLRVSPGQSRAQRNRILSWTWSAGVAQVPPDSISRFCVGAAGAISVQLNWTRKSNFPRLVTNPEFWVRSTESSEINTKTTKRLAGRGPVISFINTPCLSVGYPTKVIGSKVGRATMRDSTGFLSTHFSMSRRVLL
jgi:hypothetical protein